MEQTINERFLKFSSRVPFPEEIELGQDIILTIKNDNSEATHFFIANCVKIDHLDQQDGTMNIVYNLKFTAE